MIRHHASRPIAAIFAAFWMALVGAWPAASETDPLAARFGGPFELTTHEGKRVRDTDFRGRFMLVYFGYTHCPDICPVDLTVLTEAVERAGPAGDKVDPIFVTVDPARDTPEHLAKYRQSFHPRLVALTGSEADIAAVTKAYRVHRRKYLPDKSDPANYGVDHGSLTYLMGPDGKFRTLIPHGASAERMAELIEKYAR